MAKSLVLIGNSHFMPMNNTHVFCLEKGDSIMPKTRFQNVIFTAVMAFVMVYAMICYNIALNIGGMTNQVFLMAFGELRIMWPVAFVLELFVVDRLSHMLAMRIVTPGVDKPVFVVLAISSMIVCLMCPSMSLVATILFKDTSQNGFIAVWLQTAVMNFPMAFFWQIFFAGPFVRLLYRTVFERSTGRVAEAAK